jgi:glycerophosphoryl diester phosphodiesterase
MDAIAVIGHRGTCGTFPENTLEGFASAIEAGTDILELDVMATIDSQIIIHHDYLITPKLHLRLDGSIIDDSPQIRSLTLDEVKEYAYKPGKAKIPSLQELFDLLHTMKHPNAKKVRLMIEIKKDPLNPKQVAQQVVNLIKNSGLKERVLYASFDEETLSEVRRLDPNAELILLFEPGKALIPDTAFLLKAKILGPSNSLLKTRSQVQALKQKGFKIISWTINDPQRWQELIDMGIDGIITDYPENLARFLNRER